MKKGHIVAYIHLRFISSFDPGITKHWADADPRMAKWTIEAKIAGIVL